MSANIDNEWTVQEFAGHQIRQRNRDGYLSATDMCKVKPGKAVADFLKIKDTKEYIAALEDDLKVSSPENIDMNKCTPIVDIILGRDSARGTWVHPEVAVELAGWVSKPFRVQVNRWVHRFMQGDITLVQDVVAQADRVHGTVSDVLITTMSNQLAEYRHQMERQDARHYQQLTEYRQQLIEYKENAASLERTTAVLTTQITKLNRFVCRYCCRRYSSTGGLTRHLNHHCQDKRMADYEAGIEYERLTAYLPILVRSQPQSYSITLNTAEPSDIKASVTEHARTTIYRIAHDRDRWWLMCFLEQRGVLPTDLMCPESFSRYESRLGQLCPRHNRIMCEYCANGAFRVELLTALAVRE